MCLSSLEGAGAAGGRSHRCAQLVATLDRDLAFSKPPSPILLFSLRLFYLSLGSRFVLTYIPPRFDDDVGIEFISHRKDLAPEEFRKHYTAEEMARLPFH